MRHNLIPLSDLNLTDRFLFNEVMEDSQAHQDALSIIFGHPVPLLGKNETEKELRVSPAIRSVRMDVFSMDEEKSIYNCYTFRPRCEEQPDCILDDGTARIFLNTRGTNDSEVSKELADFLHYLEETTDEAAESSGSDRIRRIHDRVCKV